MTVILFVFKMVLVRTRSKDHSYVLCISAFVLSSVACAYFCLSWVSATQSRKISRILDSCGHKWITSDQSAMGVVVSEAINMVPRKKKALCVIEVGTADGSGTTMKIFDALYRHCVSVGGRQFVLYAYESSRDLAAKASQLWRKQSNVEVFTEFVMDELFFDLASPGSIQGPDGDVFPGRGFYENFYRQIGSKIRTGEFGPFLKTIPPCIADLVVIDSTRYTHPGIITTLMMKNITSPDTVFLIENDSWSTPDCSEERLIQQHWHLSGLSSSHPRGEMWPWITFRINGKASQSLSKSAAC